MSLETAEALGRFIAGLFALVGLPVLIYVARTIQQLDSTSRKHEQTLYGEHGDNGLKSDVRALRRVGHEHANEIQAHTWALEAARLRLDTLEKPR